MTGLYPQKGPRAHNFAAIVSIVTGISIFFEYYASNLTFTSLDGITSLSGQHLWGVVFVFLGLLLLQYRSLILRALTLILLCLAWTIFGLLSLWLSLLSPMAHEVGSAFGILAIAMSVVCILSTTNLRRDFYVTRRQWFKENPLENILDPHRPKGGDSHRE